MLKFKKIYSIMAILIAVFVCFNGCNFNNKEVSVKIPEDGLLTQSEVRRIWKDYDTRTEIKIPEGFTAIDGTGYLFQEDAPFYGCNRLQKVTIPDSVARIGQCAFCGAPWLSDITILATLPPTLGGSWGQGFNTSLSGFTIYVPEESLDLYKVQSEDWKGYAEYIKPIPQTDD